VQMFRARPAGAGFFAPSRTNLPAWRSFSGGGKNDPAEASRARVILQEATALIEERPIAGRRLVRAAASRGPRSQPPNL